MTFDPKKTIFLIDGSSFLYRAYYGTRPLHTIKGVPVQAVYSFCRMIKKLIDTFDPQYLALVWDSPGKTIRHEVYQEYKATRQAAPSDLFMQKDLIVQFADLIGIKQVSKSGYEADDLMFSIARQWYEHDLFSVLITTDKDMGQCLNERTFMYDAFKQEIVDEIAFESKMGFPARKIAFYFALLGDSSDNIPGVKGVGEKTAKELVNQFESLQELYAQLEKVSKKRTQELLQANRNNAFLSEQLFLLAPIDTQLNNDDFLFSKNNWHQARSLFEELNFSSLLADITPGVGLEQKVKKLGAYTFITVKTAADLQEVCKEIIAHGAFALDTETTGADPLQDSIIGLSVCTAVGKAYYIPFGHTTGEPQLAKEIVISSLKPLFEDASIKKYLHNAKFDSHTLYAAGIDLQGISFDSLIAAHVLLPEWQRIGLKKLSELFFDEQMSSFADLVSAHKRKTFAQVPLEPATDYAAGDAHQTLKLTQLLEKKLQEEPTIAALFYEIEMPLLAILIAMERRGIFVDRGMLGALGAKVDKELTVLHAEIVALAGQQHAEINLNSPKQVEQLLFYELKLPPQKKSAKRTGYSTDAEVLTFLATLHPIPPLILKYRELFKLKSTYIDALPLYINAKTERVHTSFSQTVVATGRLASSDPNLQNIPASGLGMEIRAAFKPELDHLFLSADYSQIELRVLAHLSGDQTLINAFLNNEDIHAQTASKLFGIPAGSISHEQRQLGKRINFSILYGLTPYGLSQDLGISFSDAKKYIEIYFQQYPAVLQWMEDVIEFTKKHGYVQTYFGRRRYIPAIYEKNKTLYDEAVRVAINTVAQGTAAEIVKRGMIALDECFKKNNLDAYMLLQIHDELLVSARKEQAHKVSTLMQEVLEQVVAWQIPLQVTIRSGSTWKEVTK